jgi:hypothetical protein
VGLAVSGSFDCADHDGAVICFAQDDGVGAINGENKQRQRQKQILRFAKDDN